MCCSSSHSPCQVALAIMAEHGLLSRLRPIISETNIPLPPPSSNDAKLSTWFLLAFPCVSSFQSSRCYYRNEFRTGHHFSCAKQRMPREGRLPRKVQPSQTEIATHCEYHCIVNHVCWVPKIRICHKIFQTPCINVYILYYGTKMFLPCLYYGVLIFPEEN